MPPARPGHVHSIGRRTKTAVAIAIGVDAGNCSQSAFDARVGRDAVAAIFENVASSPLRCSSSTPAARAAPELPRTSLGSSGFFVVVVPVRPRPRPCCPRSPGTPPRGCGRGTVALHVQEPGAILVSVRSRRNERTLRGSSFKSPIARNAATARTGAPPVCLVLYMPSGGTASAQ